MRRQTWTYAEASRTLPYVRMVLHDLRLGFISIWNLYKEAGYDVTNPDYSERLQSLGNEARATLEDLDRLGVIPYQSPLRGIALFIFLVRDGNGGREAYYVYKDTRDEIDSFIFADDLCTHDDLYGYERPVRPAWKEAGAVPILEQEARS